MRDDADTARRKLLDELKATLDKSQIRAVGHDVLIAMFNRAGKPTSGGIFIPDSVREDEFQGKVGLVLSLGPMCESAPDWQEWFGGRPPKPGDWVGVSVRDGIAVLVGGTVCRLVEWRYLRFATAVPDLVM